MRRTASSVVGDFNLTAAEVDEIAAALDAELVRGHGVDHAIIWGDEVRLESVRRDLPAYGSDHKPLLVTLSVAGELVRLLWWNVYVGQSPQAVLRAVCELADAHQPHVIALGETYRCRDVLGRVPGYRRRQLTRGEGVEIALLVRRDRRILREGVLRMTRSWTGPKHGRRHPPRAFRRVRVELENGHPFRLLAIHNPTGGHHGPNALAVREALDRIIRWGRR